MKRGMLYGTVILACVITTGCAEKPVMTSREERVVYTAAAEADFAEIADSLYELIEASDLVAEVKILETEAFLKADQSVVFTRMTPEVTELFKGEYNGEKLVMGGGYISCGEYSEAGFFDAAGMNIAFTEDELENGLVYYDWCNNYVPEAGDTIIFFGTLNENGEYEVTYSYQGIFLCEGKHVSCQALSVGRDGWTEPLASELLERFSSDKSKLLMTSGETTVQGVIIDKALFEAALR